MKNIFTFITLLSLTIFTACSNQKMEDDFAPTNEETTKLPSIDNKTNSHDNYMVNVAKADFTIDNEGTSIDEGVDLLLTNNSVNAVSYHWDFGNGDTSTEAQPTYQYEIHGNRTVTLTITDASGKTHQTSQEILVLCVFGGIDHNQ